MKKIKYLYALLFVIFCNVVAFAQVQWEGEGDETAIEGLPQTVGAQSVSVDMYVYILAIVAVAFIIAYANKMRKSIA